MNGKKGLDLDGDYLLYGFGPMMVSLLATVFSQNTLTYSDFLIGRMEILNEANAWETVW